MVINMYFKRLVDWMLCQMFSWLFGLICLLKITMMSNAWAEDINFIDPTKPLGTLQPYSATHELQSNVQLQAIYWGENRRQAVINGQLVSNGQSIAGVRIKDIQKDHVWVIMHNKQKKLSLTSSLFIKKANHEKK